MSSVHKDCASGGCLATHAHPGDVKDPLIGSVMNRDDIINSLDTVLQERMDEIEDLKKNCEKLARTEIFLEKKMKIANEVIKELSTTVAPSEEIVNLRLEIEHLKNDISEKEKLLNDIENENKFLTEELRKAKDNPIEALDDLQIEETVSLRARQ